jgi:poly(A)-specific ribonuclease
MDIGATKFSDFLPFILNDISSSCFVAIDFELSGLAFPPNGPQINTQTVQERYTEAKAAAERYQILQVGLTICHENSKNGMQRAHFHGTRLTIRSGLYPETLQHQPESDRPTGNGG